MRQLLSRPAVWITLWKVSIEPLMLYTKVLAFLKKDKLQHFLRKLFTVRMNGLTKLMKCVSFQVLFQKAEELYMSIYVGLHYSL